MLVDYKVDKKQHKCSFWYHVGLVLQQAAGLEDGFRGRNNLKPHRSISVFGLYLIGISGDMEGIFLGTQGVFLLEGKTTSKFTCLTSDYPVFN